METNTFLEKLLNNLSLVDFLVYSTMGFIGFLFSTFGQLYKAKNFNIKEWFEKQKFRMILNIFAIFLGVIFHEQLSGSPLSLLGAFEAGCLTDMFIDRFITQKTVTKKL